MTYLQKEENLVKALYDTNYAVVGGNKEVAMNFVGRCLDSFTDYTKSVIHQETQMKMINVMYEGDEFRERAEELDRNRKRMHDDAIASIAGLNRLCTKHNLPPFADIDTNNRHAVAEFIGEYSNEVYNAGIGVSDKSKERIAAYERRFGDIANAANNAEKGNEYGN